MSELNFIDTFCNFIEDSIFSTTFIFSSLNSIARKRDHNLPFFPHFQDNHGNSLHFSVIVRSTVWGYLLIFARAVQKEMVIKTVEPREWFRSLPKLSL